jgi:protocatechuate 3,4-dioxygenase beta subunit
MVNFETQLTNMERKEFLKRLGMSTVVLPLIGACGKDDVIQDTDAGACATTPSETSGPFPTKDPTSLVMTDIKSDRTGVDLTVNITVQNKNSNCEPLAGAMVDIWHCDKDGYYSEYGGTGMQSANFSAYHFLRGRQSTNNNGLAAFASIFPGWYPGRAPHIHVHIFDAAGKSLLVTQIAFPTEVCDAVYTTSTQYTKGKQNTSNAGDNVFSNSLANELAVVTGNITDGYVLAHTIIVNA